MLSVTFFASGALLFVYMQERECPDGAVIQCPYDQELIVHCTELHELALFAKKKGNVNEDATPPQWLFELQNLPTTSFKLKYSSLKF